MKKPTKSQLSEWDVKLRMTGFIDIEGGMAKAGDKCFSDGKLTTPRRLEYFKEQIEYYRLAGLFLHHYNFKSPKDKFVWRLHSEGLATRAISKETKVYLKTVQKIIRELKKEMLAMDFEELA